MHLNKLLILFLLQVILTSYAGAQTRLRLLMTTDKRIDSVYIVHWTDREIFSSPYDDTLDIRFQKTSGIDFYHINYVIKERNYFTPVCLDTGNITLHLGINEDKIAIDSVSGSKFYSRYAEWQRGYAAVKKTVDSVAIEKFLLHSFKDFSDNQFSYSIARQYTRLVGNNRDKLLHLAALFSEQPNEIKKGFLYDFANKELTGLIRNQSVYLPAFRLVNYQNRVISPPATTGLILLDFWFVGCVPCQVDHVKMAEKLSYFKEKKVHLIGISRDSSFKSWNDYLKKHKYNWTQYKIPDSKETIVDILGIVDYPKYILLDNSSKIIIITNSINEVMTTIDSLNLN